MPRNSYKMSLSMNDVYLLFENLPQSFSNIFPALISSAKPSINLFELANSPSLFDFLLFFIGLLSNVLFET